MRWFKVNTVWSFEGPLVGMYLPAIMAWHYVELGLTKPTGNCRIAAARTLLIAALSCPC